jgi:hypothetical protein
VSVVCKNPVLVNADKMPSRPLNNLFLTFTLLLSLKHANDDFYFINIVSTVLRRKELFSVKKEA